MSTKYIHTSITFFNEIHIVVQKSVVVNTVDMNIPCPYKTSVREALRTTSGSMLIMRKMTTIISIERAQLECAHHATVNQSGEKASKNFGRHGKVRNFTPNPLSIQAVASRS